MGRIEKYEYGKPKEKDERCGNCNVFDQSRLMGNVWEMKAKNWDIVGVISLCVQKINGAILGVTLNKNIKLNIYSIVL